MPAAPSIEAPPSQAAAAADAAAMGGSRANPGAPGRELSSAFDALDKKATPSSPAEGQDIPPHPAQQKKEAAKPAAKPAAKVTDKPVVKPEEAKVDETAPKPEEGKEPPPTKPDEPPKPALENKPKKPADFLREELDKTKKERDTLKAEVAKAKPAVAEAPEYKSLQEKHEKLIKEHSKLQEDLRFTAYERSPEFKDKFETPFNEAYAHGRSKVAALKVTDPGTGEPRPGKPEDFDAIMSLPEDQALEMIDSLFGSGSRGQIVTLARERVLEKFGARKAALEEAGKNLGEREKQTNEFYTALNGEVSKLWEKHTKAETIPEKHRKHLTPAEGDDVEKQKLEQGYQQVDRTAKENARDPNLTPEQREGIIGRAAAMRNRAAAYPLLVHRITAKDARIAELEAELKSFKDSEPGAGDGDSAAGDDTGPAAGTMDSVMANLEKRAKPIYH